MIENVRVEFPAPAGSVIADFTFYNSAFWIGSHLFFFTQNDEYNVFIGRGAGSSANCGATTYHNVALGNNALANVTESVENIAIGVFTLNALTTGVGGNVALGTEACKILTTGQYNFAMGLQSLVKATTAHRNVAIGVSTGSEIIGHTENVFIGHAAGKNVVGSYNTFIGAYAGYTNTAGTNNVYVGNYAGYYETGSNTFFLDNAQRASEADARVKGLMWGGFAATTAAQFLVINGVVSTPENFHVDDSVDAGVTNFFGAGDSDDFKWWHDGTDGFIKTTMGNLYLIPVSDTVIIGDGTGTSQNLAFSTLTVSGTITWASTLGFLINHKVLIGDGTDGFQFSAKGQVDLTGTARVRRHIRVAAPSWQGGGTAPTPGFVGILPVLGFDHTTDDEVHYSLLCPFRMVAGTEIDFLVDWCYTGGADAGTVCWNLEYINLTTGEAVAGATTTRTKTTAGNHTSGQLVRTVFAAGITGAVAHDVIGLRLWRDVSESDSLGTAAKLVQAHFMFVMDKLGEQL